MTSRTLGLHICALVGRQLNSSARSAVVVALLAGGSPALAQVGAAPASDAAIVVTAQKREERLQKVPISMAVLSGAALDAKPVGGVLDALNQVPSISQSSTFIGNATQLTIRGVAPAGQFLNGSATVGYYIDSTPFGLVKSSVVPDMNAYDMERVEVLRGPQGTLYGASALNGVVRVITHDPDLNKFELKTREGLSSTQGGNPGFRADAAVNIPIIPGKLAIRVVGGVESLGGWIDQPVRNKKDANDSLSKNLRVKLAYRPMDNLKIDLSAWLSRENDGTSPYADAQGNQSSPYYTPQTTNYDTYSGKITYDLPFLTISSATSYLKLSRVSYVDDNVGELYSSLPSKIFTEEFLLNSVGTGPWRASAGAFYRKGHDDLYQALDGILPLPLQFRDASQSFAGFGQLTRTFADDRFEISGGLRYFADTVTQSELANQQADLGQPLLSVSKTFHSVTPRVVATWLPSPHLTVYASYAQGFRSGFNQSPLAVLAAPSLPAVKSDKLNNYEIGAKGSTLDGLLSFEGAVFYIYWKDLQQNATVLYNGVYVGAGINGPSASGAGAELNLTLHPTRQLQFGGNISWSGLTLDGDVRSAGVVVYHKGDRIAYTSKYTANAFVTYSVPLSDNLTSHVNLSANYHSAQSAHQISGTTSSIAYSGKPLIINGNLMIETSKHQSISLYAANITNWHGLSQPAFSEQSMYRIRPRTVGLEFATKF